MLKNFGIRFNSAPFAKLFIVQLLLTTIAFWNWVYAKLYNEIHSFGRC